MTNKEKMEKYKELFDLFEDYLNHNAIFWDNDGSVIKSVWEQMKGELKIE